MLSDVLAFVLAKPAEVEGTLQTDDKVMKGRRREISQAVAATSGRLQRCDWLDSSYIL
jgi:hypothetical protein